PCACCCLLPATSPTLMRMTASVRSGLRRSPLQSTRQRRMPMSGHCCWPKGSTSPTGLRTSTMTAHDAARGTAGDAMEASRGPYGTSRAPVGGAGWSAMHGSQSADFAVTREDAGTRRWRVTRPCGLPSPGTPWVMGARGPERMSGSPRGVSISPAWEVASDRDGSSNAVRQPGGRVVNVGDRRGALTIISVDRSRGVVELVCPDGHSDTRPYESVRVSASPRCRWCVPPATPLQLETLRIIRRHEQETAEGMTRVQILE